MAALLLFPSPDDARVAAQLRELCSDFQLTQEQRTRVLSRFLRTVAEGRSNGVAVMDARRVMHLDRRHAHAPKGAA